MEGTRISGDYAGISPGALAAFALNHGWTRVKSPSATARVYANDHGTWVSIPTSREFADYELRVEQFIDTFAQALGSDASEIIDALLLADWDVVRFRGSSGDDPYVGYEAGRRLVASAEKAILAAACSLIDDSGAYSDVVKANARKLIAGAKLGQTERGSFVVKMLIPASTLPLAALDEQTKREVLEINSVGRRLASALASTRLSLDASHTESMPEAIRSGASADLCDSIAEMVKFFDAVEAQIDLAGPPEVATTLGPTSFSCADYAPLKATSKRIKVGSVATPDARRVSGYVRELHRTNQNAQVGEPGTIELEWNDENSTLTAKCELNDSDYAIAVDAHKNQRKITIEGNLTGSGRTLRILNGNVVETGDALVVQVKPLFDLRSVPDAPSNVD